MLCIILNRREACLEVRGGVASVIEISSGRSGVAGHDERGS